MSTDNVTATPDSADQVESQIQLERTPADIAADFANSLLMHRHRGVINCEGYFVIFGNDGYATDQRSRKEAADVWGKLRSHDTQLGISSDGQTWALVLTDHTQSQFDEKELERLVWDTWMAVCNEVEQ